VCLSVYGLGRVYMVWMDNLGAHIRIWQGAQSLPSGHR
jgi:hypothetical protein